MDYSTENTKLDKVYLMHVLLLTIFHVLNLAGQILSSIILGEMDFTCLLVLRMVTLVLGHVNSAS